MSRQNIIYGRSAFGLALVVAMALVGGCTLTDPEYPGLVAAARTDCKGNEIVGVWSDSSTMLHGTGIKAQVLLLRPDGTGFRRTIYANPKAESTTTQLLWHYQGAGVWTLGEIVGCAGTPTIRFAGNALAFEAKAWGTTHYVFIRMANDSLN